MVLYIIVCILCPVVYVDVRVLVLHSNIRYIRKCVRPSGHILLRLCTLRFFFQHEKEENQLKL